MPDPSRSDFLALPEASITGRLSKISLKGRDEENATIFPSGDSTPGPGETPSRSNSVPEGAGSMA